MPRKPKATRPNAKTAGAIISAPSAQRADAVGDRHQRHDAQPEPVGAEVAGDEAGQDVQRRAALARRGDDLPHVRRLGRGEDLHQLRDDRAGQRAAGDDRRQLPPQRRIAAERRESAGTTRRRSAPPRRSTSARPAASAAPRSSSSSRCRSCAFAHASLSRYDTPLAMTIMTRMTKIQTSSCTCTVVLGDGQRG